MQEDPGIMFVAILLVWVLGNAIVKIIHAARGTVGGKPGARIKELEMELRDLEADHEELRARTEVLEKIITDGKYQLDREIRNLAG